MAFILNSMGNITREVQMDLSAADFEDANGFFVRSSSGGVIKYLPFGNADNEPITKTIEASAYFIDPVIMRKVFRLTTSPDTELYIGYGV